MKSSGSPVFPELAAQTRIPCRPTSGAQALNTPQNHIRAAAETGLALPVCPSIAFLTLAFVASPFPPFDCRLFVFPQQTQRLYTDFLGVTTVPACLESRTVGWPQIAVTISVRKF